MHSYWSHLHNDVLETANKIDNANMITATAAKETPNSKVGIGFTTSDAKVILKSINEGGIFYGSSLQLGMEIDSINGTYVAGMSAEKVKQQASSFFCTERSDDQSTAFFHVFFFSSDPKSLSSFHGHRHLQGIFHTPSSPTQVSSSWSH
jgi:hypothetical protein